MDLRICLGKGKTMRRLSLATLLVLVICLAASANAAVTLDISGGQLMGASGVEVDGDLYDVEFVDGTCIALFDGCDDPGDFTFSNSTAASAATDALVNVAVYAFEQASLINGIEFYTEGAILTPYSRVGANVQVSQLDVVAYSHVYNWGLNVNVATDDLGLAEKLVYARWTPVPEPTTASLLILGLVGLAAKRRRAN